MSEIFTFDDLALLEKTKAARVALIDGQMKQQRLPSADRPKELEAFVGLLDSMDKSIMDKAKLRINSEANKQDSDTRAALTGLLLELHRDKHTTPSAVPAVPEFNSTGMEVNDGELIGGIDAVGSEVLDELE